MEGKSSKLMSVHLVPVISLDFKHLQFTLSRQMEGRTESVFQESACQEKKAGEKKENPLSVSQA